VYDGTMLVDSVREQFGVRTLEFSPEYGFKLNGKKIFLQGNAGHHDLGALGAASYNRAIERMMLQLKAFGYNTIRCSHNPYSESFTKIADRVGMLVVDELTDKWNGYWGGRQPFTAIWPGLIKEWVTRDRNSPSVILWSLGNELQMREDMTGYQGLNDWGVTMYRIMNPVVKRFDPTRKTTVAMFPSRAGAIGQREKAYKDYTMPPELAQVTEVASLNYQSAWYGDFKKHCPDLNIFQSEAETSNWLTAYYNMDREHSIGMAYWGSIEYWGESNGWPKKGWNFSFFDHTMHPYPTAWLIKSAFCESQPVARIGVLDAKGSESVSWNDIQVGQTTMLSHWNYPEGSKQRVYVFTNAPQAELMVNGKSLGMKPNDGKGNMQHVITWDVDYGKGGSATAIARNHEGKETARHELQTAGKAVKLKIEAEVSEWHADGMDLKYLNITAIDNKGRIVPDYDEPLTIDVTGPATLLALDNADHYTNELFAGIKTKKMRGGRMQVILRSQRQAGQVTVNASTPKMKISFKTATK
jgi:beta-galactosidase